MRFSELGTPLLAAATHAEVKDSKRVKSANRPFSLRDCVVPLFAINCVLDTPGFFSGHDTGHKRGTFDDRGLEFSLDSTLHFAFVYSLDL